MAQLLHKLSRRRCDAFIAHQRNAGKKQYLNDGGGLYLCTKDGNAGSFGLN